MPIQSAIQPAFRDAVRDSQSVFRLVMRAMASPGRILHLEARLASPAPLLAPAAALLLTLCDFETTVWLDPPLADRADVADFLRFHTGARLVTSAADATFAVIADPARMPALATFAQGTPDYPDRSATLIVQVDTLVTDGWTLEGPGIRKTARLSAAPLPTDFIAQLRANRASFPCGVDIVFATPTSLAALPRSVRLMAAG
jgi:alpha-D-ribose 1-methylphosphonate 5-triphosphate synthase subunit PhnH